jgi:hypothetical protein
MKTRKIVNLFAVIGFSSMVLFSSCAKDEDTNPDDPTTDDQTKFKGNWSVAEESVDFGKSTYSATISDSDSTNGPDVLIAYLYNFHTKAYATVSGNTMTIPLQTIEGLKLSGTGVLENSKRLTLKCTVRSTSTHEDVVTFTLTK